jgi:hypothetical protein
VPDRDTTQSSELAVPAAAGTEAGAGAARAKLEQIRELYENAEGMGGDGLSRHSESVSQRQQDLIHDYFCRPQHASVDLSSDSGAADPGVNSRHS